MASQWLESADASVAAVLADWSVTTTLLAVVIVAFVAYPILTAQEPDTHPLLLARQANVAPVRSRNESAWYRSPEVPFGYPLKSGLNVKDPSAPRWANGKNGDLRDIWREVQKGGSTGTDGKPIAKGTIQTVFGKEEIDEHDIEDLSKQISIMGNHLQQAGVRKLAVYLPNSIEYLLIMFVCAFYNISPILLPYDVSQSIAEQLLRSTGADGLVSSAGSLSLEDVAKSCRNLKSITWVVEKTSRHMDWNGVPDGAESLKVGVWHDIVEENKSSTQAHFPNNATEPAPIVTIWQTTATGAQPEIVSLSQSNLIAAIAASLSAIPLRQRLTAEDLVLPADSFSSSFVLVNTLAALYAHANLAITSVAKSDVDFTLATRGIAPTVIIAGAETMHNLAEQDLAVVRSVLQRFSRYTHTQTMSAGRMPNNGLLFRLLAPSSSDHTPGRLRLVLTSSKFGSDSRTLTSEELANLRIFTRSRIIHGLTASKVAGAVAQTNVFDYRRTDGGHSHFGIPLSSLEVKLRNDDDAEVAGSTPTGEFIVSGPAVAGGETILKCRRGRINDDHTISYA